MDVNLEDDSNNAPSHVFGKRSKYKELKYLKFNPPEGDVTLYVDSDREGEKHLNTVV